MIKFTDFWLLFFVHMIKFKAPRLVVFSLIFLSFGAFILIASANHSWGGYHWARTGNTFTLKLGDNVSSAWDTYLGTTSSDWSLSSVLDAVVFPTLSNPSCRAVKGRVEVCNKTYGNNGWLGLAQIWVSGKHITQATTKVNDTYFNLPDYSTPAWKQFVMCQEVGHAFGLGHQDENFNNTNLGSCMDYTNDPSRDDGLGNNLHPNEHDNAQLETIYNSHTDTTTTIKSTGSRGNNAIVDTDNPSGWGKEISQDSHGRNSLYERDLGGGHKVFTFIIWADK